MRVLLKIVAALIGLGVGLTLFTILATKGNLLLFHFVGGKPLGIMGGLKILLIVFLGPFASVQLWRLRHTGRYAVAVLAGCGVIYEIVDLMTPRGYEVDRFHMLSNLIWSAAILIAVLIPAAVQVCEENEEQHS